MAAANYPHGKCSESDKETAVYSWDIQDISERACQVISALLYGPFFTAFPFPTLLVVVVFLGVLERRHGPAARVQ